MGGERRPQVQLKGPGICAYHKNGNGRLKKRLQKSRGPESQTGSDSTGAQFVVEFGYICHYSLVFSFGVPRCLSFLCICTAWLGYLTAAWLALDWYLTRQHCTGANTVFELVRGNPVFLHGWTLYWPSQQVPPKFLVSSSDWTVALQHEQCNSGQLTQYFN